MPENDPTLDGLVRQIALALYGRAPRVERLDSQNSYVCRLDYQGTLPDKVIKLARCNGRQVRREQAVLRALAGAGLPLPVVEHTQGDCTIAAPPFTAMAWHDGASLQDGCWSDTPWVEPALRRAGRFAVRLGALPASLLAACPPGARAHFAVALEDPDVWALTARLDDGGRRAFVHQLDRLRALCAREARGVIHGSYSPAHVLCAPAGTFVVIDWENADAGPTLRDVGHFTAALKVWGPGDPRHVAWFLSGVQDEQPLDAVERDEIGDWEAFTCMIWADHFLRQGQTALAERILDVAGLAGRGQE